MLDYLQNLDSLLFFKINGCHASWLDPVMFWMSQKVWLWIPLYLLLFWLIIRRYGKQSWMILISVVILIALADQTASAILKPLVARLRPTHDPAITSMVHVVNKYVGGMYGFASSHAANTMGFAVFMVLLFRRKRISVPLISWSVLVSYSRVYLGVHYPGDVLAGMAIGTLWAFVIYLLLRFIYKKYFGDDLHKVG